MGKNFDAHFVQHVLADANGETAVKVGKDGIEYCNDAHDESEHYYQVDISF